MANVKHIFNGCPISPFLNFTSFFTGQRLERLWNGETQTITVPVMDASTGRAQKSKKRW